MSKVLTSRRQALAALASGAIAGKAIAAITDTLHFAALDHVAIAVTDVDKSVAFYASVFGNTVLKDNRSTRRYVKLGPCYVAIANPALSLSLVSPSNRQQRYLMSSTPSDRAWHEALATLK